MQEIDEWITYFCSIYLQYLYRILEHMHETEMRDVKWKGKQNFQVVQTVSTANDLS